MADHKNQEQIIEDIANKIVSVADTDPLFLVSLNAAFLKHLLSMGKEEITQASFSITDCFVSRKQTELLKEEFIPFVENGGDVAQLGLKVGEFASKKDLSGALDF